MDVPTNVADLHDVLLKQYDTNDMSKQAHAEYVDTLKHYTTAVMVASTEAVCQLLGIDSDRIHMLELTESQYHRLEESNMISTYMDGKDEMDD